MRGLTIALSFAAASTSGVAMAQDAPRLPPPEAAPPDASPIPLPPPSSPSPSAQPIALPPPTPVAEPEPLQPRSGFFVMQVGATNAHLADTSIWGVDFRIGGGAGRNIPVYGFVGMTWGETTKHLRSYTFNTGVGFDARLEPLPLRVGIGIQLEQLNIRRASSGSAIRSLGAGIFGQATLDLIRFDDAGSGALTVTLRIHATAYDSAFLWGPSLLAGIRL